MRNQNILKIKIPNWLRNISYTVMLLEAVVVVIVYHTPDFFIKVMTQFV